MALDLQTRLARHYGLPLQVASFFAILILSENTTAASTFKEMGSVDVRGLIHKLRKALKISAPLIEIQSKRAVGYWLDDDTRRALAFSFGVELGISISPRPSETSDENIHRSAVHAQDRNVEGGRYLKRSRL